VRREKGVAVYIEGTGGGGAQTASAWPMRVAWNVAPAALDAPISISNGGFPGEAGASAISSDRAGWLNNELCELLGK